MEKVIIKREYQNYSEYYCKSCYKDDLQNLIKKKKEYKERMIKEKINYPFICDKCPTETDRGYKITYSNLKEEIYDRTNYIIKPNMNNGIVYVLSSIINGVEYYKIGKTTNLKKRLKAFPVNYPIKTNTEYIFYTDNINSLELGLHKQFSNKRVEGEWFKLDLNDLRYLNKLQDLLN